MDISRLETLQRWFDAYVAGFQDIDPEGLRNIRLKIEHTRQVCHTMRRLAAGEGLDPSEAATAEAIALLHDVGRFPQYLRWRTFRDSESDNHARLGLEVIREERLLEGLPAEDALLIEEAVRFHNLLELPEKLQSPTPLFARLIRDADKLDIWRVFLEHSRQKPEERASAASLGFPDLPQVSPACIASLAAGQVVRLDQVRFLNDFKLLQISWAYDLHFRTSYRLLLESGNLEGLAATITADDGAGAAIEAAMVAVRERAA